jgi:hypothetical protein
VKIQFSLKSGKGKGKGNGKAVPLEAWSGPEGSKSAWNPKDNYGISASVYVVQLN